MPVGIVQVINNTSRRFYYSNTKTGHKLQVRPKTQEDDDNDRIPASNFYDDEVPLRSSQQFIKLQFNIMDMVVISDHNWKFWVKGPAASTIGEVGKHYGNLDNGGQYMLLLDEVVLKGTWRKQCSITILRYEGKYKVTNGSIGSHLMRNPNRLTSPIVFNFF